MTLPSLSPFCGAVVHKGQPPSGEHYLMTEEGPVFGYWSPVEEAYVLDNGTVLDARGVLGHCAFGTITDAHSAWTVWMQWARGAPLDYDADDVQFYFNHFGNAKVLHAAE